MYQYFKTAIEPLNEDLAKTLGIREIVVKYDPHVEKIEVLTTGEVIARSECQMHHLGKIGV